MRGNRWGSWRRETDKGNDREIDERGNWNARRERLSERRDRIVVLKLFISCTIGLGGMTVLRYTRVFRNTDGMIFNTIKNTDLFLSISVAKRSGAN